MASNVNIKEFLNTVYSDWKINGSIRIEARQLLDELKQYEDLDLENNNAAFHILMKDKKGKTVHIDIFDSEIKSENGVIMPQSGTGKAIFGDNFLKPAQKLIQRESLGNFIKGDDLKFANYLMDKMILSPSIENWNEFKSSTK